MRKLTLASLLLLLATPAYADAIDGAWCREPALRLMISGPTIVTPRGARLQGNYDRHNFSYVIPAGEPNAGATMQMHLLGEELMQSRIGESGAIDSWRRCGPPVS